MNTEPRYNTLLNKWRANIKDIQSDIAKLDAVKHMLPEEAVQSAITTKQSEIFAILNCWTDLLNEMIQDNNT